MSGVTVEEIGLVHDGRPLRVATLVSRGGARMRILNLGGIVWSLEVPDAAGALSDVVLGYDDPADYLGNPHYLGALIGRYANRIGGAGFDLDGAHVQLTRNLGRHHLHGGARGFHKMVWDLRGFASNGTCGVELTHLSPHGTEGFPGNLETRVTYTLSDGNEWDVSWEATTDRPTPVNVTQHAYFNLAGHGTVVDHELKVAAAEWLPVDADQIPTGAVETVAGTPFDLRTPARLAERLGAPALAATRGYDHTLVLCPGAARAAVLRHPPSGRVLAVTTSEPALHLYTGNFLAGTVGKVGVPYAAHAGLCLETQHFPDAPNHAEFPSTILRPGALFTSRTRYAFSVMRPD